MSKRAHRVAEMCALHSPECSLKGQNQKNPQRWIHRGKAVTALLEGRPSSTLIKWEDPDTLKHAQHFKRLKCHWRPADTLALQKLLLGAVINERLSLQLSGSPLLQNQLLVWIRETDTLSSFRITLQTFLFNKAYSEGCWPWTILQLCCCCLYFFSTGLFSLPKCLYIIKLCLLSPSLLRCCVCVRLGERTTWSGYQIMRSVYVQVILED